MADAHPRRWAALSLLLLGPVTAVIGSALLPEPSGHWSGHMASAFMSTGVGVAVAIGAGMVWKHLPWHAFVALAAIEVGLVVGVLGNVRVARSLWATSYDDVEAATVGPTRAGYEWGHDVVDRGDLLVVAGALGLAASLALSHRIGPVMGATWGVLAFFPPFIYPALSALVLLASLFALGPERGERLWAERRDATAPEPTPGPQ